MASPLPNTNAPASAKYQPIVARVPAVAGPWMPVRLQSGSTTAADPVKVGGAFTSMARSPAPTNNHTISDSVQAVTSALTAKIAHINRSLLRLIFVSFHALRATMAITAEPTP